MQDESTRRGTGRTALIRFENPAENCTPLYPVFVVAVKSGCLAESNSNSISVRNTGQSSASTPGSVFISDSAAKFTTPTTTTTTTTASDSTAADDHHPYHHHHHQTASATAIGEGYDDESYHNSYHHNDHDRHLHHHQQHQHRMDLITTRKKKMR